MFRFNYLKNNKYKKGFSLAEVLIVLGILTFGMLGVASLLLQNLQVENLTKNYLVASALAQEGVEVVRNIRDENWVLRQDWLTSIPVGTFAVDYRGRTSVDDDPDLVSDDGARLYLDGVGLYNHDLSLRTTSFSRLITVEDFGDYILVTSDVMWSGRFGERHYTIQTTLFNWRG